MVTTGLVLTAACSSPPPALEGRWRGGEHVSYRDANPFRATNGLPPEAERDSEVQVVVSSETASDAHVEISLDHPWFRCSGTAVRVHDAAHEGWANLMLSNVECSVGTETSPCPARAAVATVRGSSAEDHVEVTVSDLNPVGPESVCGRTTLQQTGINVAPTASFGALHRVP